MLVAGPRAMLVTGLAALSLGVLCSPPSASADYVLNYATNGVQVSTGGPSITFLGTYWGDGMGGYQLTINTGKTDKLGNTSIVGGTLNTTIPYPVAARITDGSIQPIPDTAKCADRRSLVTVTYSSPRPKWTTMQFIRTEQRRPLGPGCITIGVTADGVLNRP